MEALTNTFARPVNSGLNPLPSSSSATTRPRVMDRPALGRSVFAMICSSVLLPLPLRPMMPTLWPARICRLTSFRAKNSRRCACARPMMPSRTPPGSNGSRPRRR